MSTPSQNVVSMMESDQVERLMLFLYNQDAAVANIILEQLLPYTQAASGQVACFKKDDLLPARTIRRLSLQKNDDKVVKNALIALTNLSGDEEIRRDIVSDVNAITTYANQILLTPEPPYARFSCMLLSNLAREQEIMTVVHGPLLDALVQAFTRHTLANPRYTFLGFVFVEIARHDPLSMAKLLPQLIYALRMSHLAKRQAIAAAIKNCLFDIRTHQPLTEDTPLIETIMISLMDPRVIISAEEAASFPKAVRQCIGAFYEPEKDEDQQILLLECLLLLSSSREGRDALRAKNTYYVVRELHRASTNVKVIETSERFVNMVMRGDPNDPSKDPSKLPESKKLKTQSADPEEDDEEIQEVV